MKVSNGLCVTLEPAQALGIFADVFEQVPGVLLAQLHPIERNAVQPFALQLERALFQFNLSELQRAVFLVLLDFQNFERVRGDEFLCGCEHPILKHVDHQAMLVFALGFEVLDYLVGLRPDKAKAIGELVPRCGAPACQ